MTKFDCTEVTLCSWQLIKIQLVTKINVHSFIQVIGWITVGDNFVHRWLTKACMGQVEFTTHGHDSLTVQMSCVLSPKGVNTQ